MTFFFDTNDSEFFCYDNDKNSDSSNSMPTITPAKPSKKYRARARKAENHPMTRVGKDRARLLAALTEGEAHESMRRSTQQVMEGRGNLQAKKSRMLKGNRGVASAQEMVGI